MSIAFIICSGSILNGLTHTISWDTLGYYWYLPQFFIYDGKLTDLSLVESLRLKYDLCESIYQFNLEPNGKYVIRYTIGQAIFMLPFFLLGHATAWALGCSLDGFSNPYLFWQVFGSIFYLLLSLALLLRVLGKRLGEKIASFSIFLIFMGTNLLFAYTDNVWKCSTHNYLFFGLSVLFYIIDNFRSESITKTSLLCGFWSALIVLTRPPDVCFLLPVLSIAFIKIRNPLRVLRFFTNCVIAGIPLVLLQIFYWKAFSGNWIYIGYQNPAEGFDFPGTHIIKNLFYFRKGWLIYTPIMFFALFGAFWFFKKEKIYSLVILITLIIHLIIVSSWSVWWWSQSYGHRAMIESYALWALPFAYGIEKLLSGKLKRFFFVLLILLCFLNIFKIWQYHKGILHPSRTTLKYYFSTFFDFESNPEKQKLLWFDFDSDPMIKKPSLSEYSRINLKSSDSLILEKNNVFPFGWIGCFSALTSENHAYFRFRYSYRSSDTLVKPLLVFGFKHKGRDYAQKYFSLIADSAVHELLMVNPELRDVNDSVFIFIWNNAHASGLLKDIKIDCYTPNN